MNAQERAKAVSAAELMVRRVVREELRRCGFRPQVPKGPGAWTWDVAADEWVRVAEGKDG